MKNYKEISIKFKLPTWLYKFLKKQKDKNRSNPDGLNLLGDRDIEWSWVCAHIGKGPGKVLDFGSGTSRLGLVAAQAGFQVTCIDLRNNNDWYFFHDNLSFIQGDFLKINFVPKSLDLIINCSSVEHAGLSGRYGVTEDDIEGDLKVMDKMRSLLKLEGEMLLTVPVGKDNVFKPFHRVYGEERLPKLLQGYKVKKKNYWIKNDQNRWILADEQTAFRVKSSLYFCALGCFFLQNGQKEK